MYCRAALQASAPSRGDSFIEQCAHIGAGTGLTPPTSAPGLGSPRPHLRRDWAHPAHICARTGLTPPTSAPSRGDSFIEQCADIGAVANALWNLHSGAPLLSERRMQQRTQPTAVSQLECTRGRMRIDRTTHAHKRIRARRIASGVEEVVSSTVSSTLKRFLEEKWANRSHGSPRSMALGGGGGMALGGGGRHGTGRRGAAWHWAAGGGSTQHTAGWLRPGGSIGKNGHSLTRDKREGRGRRTYGLSRTLSIALHAQRCGWRYLPARQSAAEYCRRFYL
jgi:hypothetical protein